MNSILSPSPHFQLQQLADGVYAAIALDGGAAISNAGIIDLGDRTLVFDTFLTPRAATDLRMAAETLTGRVVSYAINSHWHNDHIRGNQVFAPETEILTSRATKHLIESKGAAELQEDAENAPAQIKALENRLSRENTPADRAETNLRLAYFKALAESTIKLKLRLPTWCFEGKLSFYGTARSAELIEIGPAHTLDDTILFLPDDQIAFVADLLFVRSHPYMAESNLKDWLKALDRIEQLNPRILVPGHGPLGAIADVQRLRQYILDIQQVHQPILESAPIPEAYADWKQSSFYLVNLHSLHKNHTHANGNTK